MAEIRPLSHLHAPDFGFPLSRPMLGFPIPGVVKDVGEVRIATYPDGTDDPLVDRRKEEPGEGPVIHFPTMDQELTKGHIFDQLLDALTTGTDRGQEDFDKLHGGISKIKKLLRGKRGPTFSEGYTPVRENRTWRQG